MAEKGQNRNQQSNKNTKVPSPILLLLADVCEAEVPIAIDYFLDWHLLVSKVVADRKNPED